MDRGFSKRFNGEVGKMEESLVRLSSMILSPKMKLTQPSASAALVGILVCLR